MWKVLIIPLVSLCLVGSESISNTYDDWVAHPCPDPYGSNTWMWHTIPNVGAVKLVMRPPQKIQVRYGPAYVKYVPSSIDPANAPDGSVWGAEGPYDARRFHSLVRAAHFVAPVPGSFQGTVWPMSPPPDEPPGEDCGDEEELPLEMAPPSTSEAVSMTTCGGGGSGTESGSGSESGSGTGTNCSVQYGVIEISYDGGITWEVWWEGYYTVCEE